MAYGTSAYGTSPWGSVSGVEASAGASTETPTTTWAAIRAQMVSVIRGLTPKALASETFRVTQSETADFRDWADEHDLSVFREFEVEDLGHTALAVGDQRVQLRETECEVVVAYPEHWGKYKTKDADNRANEQSMRAVIEADANTILKAIGRRGSANYLSAQHAAIEESWSTEAGDGVTFLVLPLTVTYYYDAR